MIERRGEWIVATTLFIEPGQEKFRELGIEGDYEVLEPCPIRFKEKALIGWYEGNAAKPTVIVLESGDIFWLTTPLEEFDKFILGDENK